MDTGYLITVPIIVALLGTFAWWQWRRMVDKSDKDQAEKETAIKANIKSIEDKQHECEKQFLELKADINLRVTNERMDLMRKEIKDDAMALVLKVDNLALAMATQRGRRK